MQGRGSGTAKPPDAFNPSIAGVLGESPPPDPRPDIETSDKERNDMATTTDSAKSQASSAAKRARDEIETGAEQVATKAKSTARTAARSVKREAGEIEASLTRGAEELAATVSGRLRSAGVDTDKLVEVAREQATDLQKLLEDEIRERPLRALGVAAAIGLFVGFLSAR